ncbi:extensin-like domain-containing protein [Parasphingorhabdus cellanae]|uniref:extensin-like domain-containing protein n=1 Tax=Parasphingorhabdus cellanae TaxID=2806553 RepID=UPI0035C0C7AC
MRWVRGSIRFLIYLSILAVLVLIALSYLRQRPQDLPWTELRLDHPIGIFTGRKLAKLGDDFAGCRMLLDAAGVVYEPLPPVGTDQCVRDDNVRLLKPGTGQISFAPQTVAPSCPVVAGLTVWQDQVVQPAAREIFGQRVVSIRHLGSYSCRTIAGGDAWSEHATGNAIDIAAFTLADGTVISLSGHWDEDGPKGRFLRIIRDGSCDLFSSVLSPDYNAAHADHFHFDQAQRGTMGYRICR